MSIYNFPGGNVYLVRGQGAAVGSSQATSASTVAAPVPDRVVSVGQLEAQIKQAVNGRASNSK